MEPPPWPADKAWPPHGATAGLSRCSGPARQHGFQDDPQSSSTSSRGTGNGTLGTLETHRAGGRRLPAACVQGSSVRAPVLGRPPRARGG